MKLIMVMEMGVCMVLFKLKELFSINVVMFEWFLFCFILVDIFFVMNNFCKMNIIGDGGFGIVYKVILFEMK